ncbi:TonB-dependent receptor [Croceicoccus mobilis]|uniref:TonB-dependent receptor n=1 Tax=Croceicoccus mobilis TaxID=1703339 RepID=A0A917DZB2_9SPHN|nr:TonB-dependent receptor [Croceicoccus mobilis]GGD81189.1 TonB-dependent receptor [Croceicoccus mobilis]
MASKKKSVQASLLAVAFVLGSNASTAYGQAADTSAEDGADTTGSANEIIVTAQKREQSLNDVGLSITAASGDQLTNLGITNTGDLAKVTPGFTFTKSQDGTPLYTLRGVGFNDYTLGASPAVSVYVDQVPLAFGAFTQGASLDLERVEVLKGPQGILFGQNSTGGAINYIAAKPTDYFEAGASASFGRFNTFEANGFVSGPVADGLGVRAAVGTTISGPWQYNYNRDEKLGRQDKLQGRFQAAFEPSDRMSFLLSVNGWRDKSDTQAGQFQGLYLQIDETAVAAGGLFDPEEVLRRIAAFRALEPAPDNARAADWDPNRDLRRDDGFYQISLRSDFELTGDITLTSITAYSNYNENYSVDRDGTSLINAGVNADGTVDSFSQEIRLAGETGIFNWLIGGNYATNDVVSANDILTGDSTNTAILPGGPYIAASTTTITQDIEDIAVFGNVEAILSDQLTVLAGARYTETTNDYTSCMRGDFGMQTTFAFLSDVLSGTPGAPAGPDTCLNMDQNTFELIRTPFEDTLKEDNFSWRVGANFAPDSDTLLYALASRGFKSGSFPTVPASTTAQFAPVTQESVTAYEAGAKLTLLDGMAQLNLAGFHYIYNDKQVRGLVIDPIFNQLEQLVNIPKARINGGEIELTARPIDGLTLRGAVTYVDSKVKEFTGINNERILADYSGSSLPFSPKWHVVADVNYERPVSAALNAFAGANLLYNSSTNSTLGDAPNSVIDSFTTVDLRVGIKAADDAWSFSVWGRNVFDEYYWTNQFVTQDVVVRYAAMPASYGATVKFEFR